MKSLRAKLIALVVAAILPAIGAVGWLMANTFTSARNSATNNFVQMAEMAALSIEGITRGAARVGKAYVNNPDLVGRESCIASLTKAAAAYPDYAGFVVLSGGRPVCEYLQEAITLPPEAIAAASAMTDTSPTFGWIDREPGLLLWTAVKADGPGDLAFIVLVADEIVRRTSERVILSNNTFFNLVRLDGTVLDGSRGAAQLPPSVIGAIDETRRGDEIVTAIVNGQRLMYSIQNRPTLGVAVVVGKPEKEVLGDTDNQILLAAAAPFLLLASAILTIWVGLERLVLRWLRRIQGVARAYAAGGITARCGAMPGAPDEVSQFGRSFDSMADSIAERTVDLETEIAQKRRYIRELHHRVKNNLQVITSMLALQRRNLPEDKRVVLRFPEERVNAMSAAYRAAYAQSESGDIDAAVVIAEVIARLQVTASAQGLQIDQTIDTGPTLVNLDEAVALSMLLAELLPLRFDHFAAIKVPMPISVRKIDSSLAIVLPAAKADGESNPLSARFIDAYLRQLSASMDEKDGLLIVKLPLAKA